jgi:hypothetical protein
MVADRGAKAVPFSEFAPDHVLRFTTADLIALELVAYGITAEELEREQAQGKMREPWTRAIERRLSANDARFIQEAVRIGVKKPGGFDRPEIKPEDLADLPFAPAEIVRKIADALACAITGRAYADVIAEREAAEQEAAKAAA